MPARRLILIADDYGISPGVSAGIRELAERRRLTGTGVMATMKHWPAEAGALKDLHGNIAVGLHFTLSDQPPRRREFADARGNPRGNAVIVCNQDQVGTGHSPIFQHGRAGSPTRRKLTFLF